MAQGVDLGRLQALEQRLTALEGQSGQGPTAHGEGSGGGGMDGGQGQGQGQGHEALVQAFLQGVMAASALTQAASQAAPAGAAGQAGASGQATGGQTGAAPQSSIFGVCWSPTSYDSIFWCRSRFMCNPQSLSCLC